MKINDFFDYSNDDKIMTMYKYNEDLNDSNKIYILNSYGKKIVQLIIHKEENAEGVKFAQIKVIPYSIKKLLDATDLTNKFKRFYNAELTYQAKITQPIEGFNINGYKLFIRATKSKNTINPYFVFYNNKNFYDIFLDRDMRYKNKDGSTSKAINMKNKENNKSEKEYQVADGILISKFI